MCGALLSKFAAFRERCVAAKRVVEAALVRLHYCPISTSLIRSVDRVAHKLVLELKLGLDAKVVNMHHEYDEDDLNKCIIQCDDPSKIIIDMDDADGLTDVLNDFEEIRNSLNEVDHNIGFNDSEFNDINHENFVGGSFNEHVDRLLRGKEMNNDNDLDDLIKKTEFNAKNISNGVKDIVDTECKGKDITVVKKSLGNGKNLALAKKALQEDDSNSFDDAEDLLNANMNDILPEDINFNDVSINTTDLNDNDNSNLVETFNNFIFDHDYSNEKFLIETRDAEIMKKRVAIKKTDEDAVTEAIPKLKKRDKLQQMKEIANRQAKHRVPTKPRKKQLSETVGTETRRPTKNLQNLKAKYEDESGSMIDQNEIPDDGNDDEVGDFVKFGNDFNFRIFVMSREEQLEELQKKREGVLFLGAPYKCELCAKGFRSEVTHKNHMKVHDISRGRFPCGVCRARHATAARRRRHADAHRLKFCCTRCEFVARTREKAEAHFEWHAGKTFSCDYCGEIFGKLSTQLSHVRLRHPGACAACAACGEAFVGQYGLLLHARRMHPSDSQPAPESRAALQRRRASPGRACAPGSRPCAECGEGLGPHAALPQPRRLRHADAPLRCPLCDATFSSTGSRQTHVERVHLGVRPRKRDGATRVKSATPPTANKKKVMCEICGNKYHSAAALRYHQRAHSGERPYACARCPKAFAFAYTLQAHERTHTGERPFRCARCPRAFRTATNLARHRRAVHLGQKNYSRCWICLRWLTSPSAARLHVATVHNDAPWPRKRRTTTTAHPNGDNKNVNNYKL